MAETSTKSKLNTFYGQKMNRKFNHKYLCKSRSFRAVFRESEFNHVNFRGAIITSSSFKKCKFNGVEFLGTNLKRCNFEGAHFKNTIFVGALLEGCKFKNATFENVIFVNMNFENVKFLNLSNPQIKILKEYPKIVASVDLQTILDDLIGNRFISTYKVLHTSTKKINHLNLKILLETFSEENLIKGLEILKVKNTKDIYTVSSLINYLKRELCV
ncbi:pentapeptide repeat-containing protein [Paenibacillus stellifer]|uniref:pentapeptide repeat-containing protein n=1 Tax=Paenibacillus stellifer TaxID=169760 RepID=UPI00068CEA3B|nr:pentapeptide repeat-containing protein [Paenibacillus stellifer]